MIIFALSTNAQIDTISREQAKEKEKFHSPKTATLLALIPSAGQAYNRKYWKMPIVYATMGTCIYFAISNQQQFSRFKKAYMQRDNGEHDEFCRGGKAVVVGAFVHGAESSTRRARLQ